MSQDAFFYCAPCRLKALIAPLGQVRTSYFSQCLQLLHQNRVISFKELDQERLSKAMFTPSAFPQGQLLFEYLTEWEPYYAYLEDFQPWRKLYAVRLHALTTLIDRKYRSSQSKIQTTFQMKPDRQNWNFSRTRFENLP
jgi:hypothetical protein